MSELSGTTAWLCFLGTNSPARHDIIAALRNVGMHVNLPAGKPADNHGIVCFSELTHEVISFLHQFRGQARSQVLALGTGTETFPAGGAWRLLSAGASEVLVWNPDGTTASQIRSKFERWSSIDALSESAAQEVALVGDSAPSRNLARRITEAARFTDSPILLVGESGTGKELLARLVHQLNGRRLDGHGRAGDLVTVDCSTIVPELSGSELFGHERGAFTGAVSPREGAFALAHGGTLFLDEIGELPLNLQTQLMRAIQEKTYKRVGGNVWQTSEFRLVCATNQDLSEAVERGRFRLDLYHRIAGWVFRTVPLRERRDEIVAIARHFLAAVSPDHNLAFDEAVSEFLMNRSYPGNVRELRQLVLRMAHRHVGPGPVTIGDIPEEDRPVGAELERAWPDDSFEKSIADAVALGAGLKEITQVTSETAIRIAVQSENGNLQRAAKRLGITDRALQIRRAAGRIQG